MHPGEKSLDNPAPPVTAKPSTMRRITCASGLVGRDHLHALTAKLFIELIAVVRFTADQDSSRSLSTRRILRHYMPHLNDFDVGSSTAGNLAASR